MAAILYGIILFTALFVGTWLKEQRPSFKQVFVALLVIVAAFCVGWNLAN